MRSASDANTIPINKQEKINKGLKLLNDVYRIAELFGPKPERAPKAVPYKEYAKIVAGAEALRTWKASITPVTTSLIEKDPTAKIESAVQKAVSTVLAKETNKGPSTWATVARKGSTIAATAVSNTAPTRQVRRDYEVTVFEIGQDRKKRVEAMDSVMIVKRAAGGVTAAPQQGEIMAVRKHFGGMLTFKMKTEEARKWLENNKS